MNKIFAIAMCALVGSPAFGGIITGTVHAEPKPGAAALPGGPGGPGGYEKRAYKFVPRVDYAGLRDFVVYVDGVTVTNLAPATNVQAVTTTKVAQHRAEFFPHILPVQAGTRVEWPNDDDIFHNVFSDSDTKKFDLELYKGSPPEKRVTFDKAGKVDVYCSIHANMHCVVLVLENPYFARTDANGHYTITNVPPGTYKLKAWHERLPADEREITVPAEGATNADFVLTIKNLPKY